MGDPWWSARYDDLVTSLHTSTTARRDLELAETLGIAPWEHSAMGTIRCAAATYAVVFLLGFGALAIIASTTEQPTGLPGMWDYWSGTIGDGILLPLVCAGLVSGVSRLKTLAVPGFRLGTALACLVGATAGAVSQATWLLDPNPRLNWMIIEVNTLSFAGWYHLVFLIITSAFICGTSIELILRAKSARSVSLLPGPICIQARTALREVFGSSLTIAVLASAFLFGATVIADGAGSLDTVSSQGMVFGNLLGIAASVVVAALFLRRQAIPLFFSCGCALLLASSVIVVATEPKNQTGIAAISLAASALVGIAMSSAVFEARPSRYQNLPLASFPVIIVFIVSFSFLLPEAAVAPAIALILGLAGLSWWIRHHDPNPDTINDRIRLVALGAAAVTLTLVIGRALPTREPTTATLIVAAVIGFFVVTIVRQLVSRAIVASWVPLIAAETSQDLQRPGSPRAAVRPVAARVWTTSFGLGVAAFIALLPIAYSLVGNTLSFGTVWPDPSQILTLVAVTAASLALAWRIIGALRIDDRYPRDDPPELQPISIPAQAMAFVALLLLATLATYFAVDTGWHTGFSWFLIVILAIVSIDTFETVLVSSTFLCKRRPTPSDYIIAGVATAASGLILYWALLSSSTENTEIGYVFLQFLLCALTRMAIVQIAGGLIASRGRLAPSTIQPTWWNQGQDEFIRMVLVLIVIWFPVYALTHSEPNSIWVNALSATVPIVVLASDLFVYASKRNIDYVREQSLVRFQGRFAATWDTTADYATILPIAASLVKARPRFETAHHEQALLTDSAYFRAFSAHIAFITIARFVLLLSTIAYFLVILTESLMGKSDVLMSYGSSTPTPD